MNMIIGLVLMYANCMQHLKIEKGYIAVTLSLSVLLRLDLNQ